MACGGCKGGGNRHGSKGEDLRKYAYLNPQQLEYLKSLEEQEARESEDSGKGKE